MSAVAVAMLIQAGTIVTGHSASTGATVTTVETSCNGRPIVLRFVDDDRAHPVGRILSVRIEGREVPGAREALQMKAAFRRIVRVDILNCGAAGRNAEALGEMELQAWPDIPGDRAPTIFFRLGRQGLRVVP